MRLINDGFYNTVVGYNAGQNISDGNYNTCIGSNAGDLITTGVDNICIGYSSGSTNAANSSVTIGNNITNNLPNTVLIGNSSNASIRCDGNCDLGTTSKKFKDLHLSGEILIAGENTVPIITSFGSGINNYVAGTTAGDSLTTGTDNIAIGTNAGTALTLGHDNILFGTNAGTSLIGNFSYGHKNVCIGTDAGSTMTLVAENTYIGHTAGKYMIGNSNTSLGTQSLTGVHDVLNNIFTTVCDGNTAIGYYALSAIIEGDYNTTMGYNSGQNISAGEHNTCVGSGAGQSITTGNDNICIGYQADAAAATLNSITIGNNSSASSNTAIIGNSAITSMSSNGNGVCSLGTTSKKYKDLHLSGTANIGTNLHLGGEAFINDFSTRVKAAGLNGVDSSYYVGGSIGTGTRNTIIGGGTGTSNSFSGARNVGMGYYALTDITTGNDNSAIGAGALLALTQGLNNTAIGFQAGAVVTTGNSNTFLGDKADTTSGTFRASMAIGYNASVDVERHCVIGGADTHPGTGSSLYAIKPGTTGCDLGTTGRKFKDLHLGGSVIYGESIVSGSGTQAALTGTDHTVLYSNAAAKDVALPALASHIGRQYILINTGAGALTINTNGGELIDGALGPLVLSSAHDRVVLLGSAATWYTI